MEQTTTYRWEKVCLDNLTGDGYTVPPTDAWVITEYAWNGWRIPYFTREGAEAVMKAWNESAAKDYETDGDKACEPPDMYFDPQRDGYLVSFPEAQETEVYEGEDIEVEPGKTVHVYGIGAMAWVWDEPMPEQNEGQ